MACYFDNLRVGLAARTAEPSASKIRVVCLTLPLPKATSSLPRGSNSVVECNLAKVDVEGSNPFSRSEMESCLTAAFLVL